MTEIKKTGVIGHTQISETSVWIRVEPDGNGAEWTRIPEGARVEVVFEDTPKLLIRDLTRYLGALAADALDDLPPRLRDLLERARTLGEET